MKNLRKKTQSQNSIEAYACMCTAAACSCTCGVCGCACKPENLTNAGAVGVADARHYETSGNMANFNNAMERAR